MRKLTREIILAEATTVIAPEYLGWSEQEVTFGLDDHPSTVARPGHAALVVEAQIADFNMSKVFMDGGSGLNLLFANTLRAMGISPEVLSSSDTTFHRIIPTIPAYPYGKISLIVVFGKPDNFRKEHLEFEVVDWDRNITPS